MAAEMNGHPAFPQQHAMTPCSLKATRVRSVVSTHPVVATLLCSPVWWNMS